MSDLKIGVDLAISTPDQVATSAEMPSALLRWNEGVLEQSIELKEWSNKGVLINWIHYWRPVPTFNASALG